MKNKYISKQSSELLTWFRNHEMERFDYKDAFKALPGSKKGAVRELLSDMTKRGLLMRLKEGKYYIIPYEQDSITFMPDWHLVAECLAGAGNYYIGYYSALEILGLITQPSLKEQIVVQKQIKPSTIYIKNVPFQFIFHNGHHFFGYKETWIDSYNRVMCSDLEKTIIDCLFKPSYAGGIVEISKAIILSKDQIDFTKLLDYLNKFKSQAVIKRVGFLLELLEINNNIIDLLLKMRSDSYVILDTELPNKGKFISKWSIQQNIESETIKSVLYT